MVEVDDPSKSSLLAWYVCFDSWIREAGLRFQAPDPRNEIFGRQLYICTCRLDGRFSATIGHLPCGPMSAESEPGTCPTEYEKAVIRTASETWVRLRILIRWEVSIFFGVRSRIAGWCAGSSAQVVGLFRRLQRHRAPRTILRPAPLDCKSIRVRIGPRNFDTSRMVCFK